MLEHLQSSSCNGDNTKDYCSDDDETKMLKSNKTKKPIGEKHDFGSGHSLFSFCNGDCVGNYDPNSMFKILPTMMNKNI